MYTVMLIDDEPWALESLYKVFPWSDSGFRVIGRYQNSMEGWKAIQDLKPDVVFADVRMPEISGLELAERAQGLYPEPLFVVVSGYSDFEYAKQALDLGVFTYCLKPIARANAQGILSRIKAALDKRYRERGAALIEAIADGSSGYDLFRQAGQSCTGEYWCAAVMFAVDDLSQDDVNSALSGVNFCIIYRSSSRMIIVANGDEQIGLQLEHAMRSLQKHRRVYAGISRTDNRANHITQRLSEAQGCVYAHFLNQDAVLTVYSVDREENHAATVASLIEAVNQGNSTLWKRGMSAFQAEIVSGDVQMYTLCQIWNRLMNAFFANGKAKLQEELEWVTEPEELVNLFEDVQEMIQYLNDLMSMRMHGNDDAEGQYENQMFAEMVEYVRTHYMEHIHLSDLAHIFHMNMTYCSEVFHRTAGITFTDYLNRLRMEHAKRELLNGDCDLQMLALQIGYNDYVTFSKKFKKYFGKAPSYFAKSERAR